MIAAYHSTAAMNTKTKIAVYFYYSVKKLEVSFMQSNPKEPVGKILADLCRTRATLADKLVDNYGIYHGQAILLMTLSNQDGITHSDLADNLKISPAAISKVLSYLFRVHIQKVLTQTVSSIFKTKRSVSKISSRLCVTLCTMQISLTNMKRYTLSLLTSK